MDQLKDNPEAREQIRRAMEEYRRSMDQGRRPPEGAFREFRGGFPAPEGLPPFGGDGFAGGFGGLRGLPFRGGAPRLGVVTGPVPDVLAEQLDLPQGRGLIVADVLKGSAAEKAGLKRSDVLLTFAGKDVPANPAEFAELVAQTKPGEKVSATVLRKGKKEEIKDITLPEPEQPRRPGAAAGFGGGFGPGGIGPANRVAFERVEAVVRDDKFDIKAAKGDVRYEITGRVEGGRHVVTSVRIADGEETNVDSVAKVPEKHRPAVLQLLGTVGAR